MTLKLLVCTLMIGLMALPVLATETGKQSTLSPEKAEAARTYPQIVLYSVAWCPHCRETKEYFTKNNIPFINRDVEMDEKAMTDLTGKYNSTGVPVIVIGSGKDEVVVRGFTPESFQNGLKKLREQK